MADKLPSEDGIDPKKLKKTVADIKAKKEKAAEINGEAGQLASQIVKDHDLDGKAFKFTLALSKKDPAQQQATLRSVMEYAHKLGMLDAIDAFDPILPRFRKIIEDVERRQHNSKTADPALDELTGDEADAA